MKTSFLSSHSRITRRRAVVVLFAMILMLVLFVFPIRASGDIVEASAGDVSDLVGVKVGDWVKYSVSVTGPAWSGNWEKFIDWIRIDMQNVSGTFVTVRERTHYKNGDETISTRTADLRTHSVGPYSYIIATNHIIGDRILIEEYEGEDPFHKFFINGTVSKQYLGVNRDVTYSISPFTTYHFIYQIKGASEHYWDRETGFLLGHPIEGFFVGYENSTFSRQLIEIADTNIWETETKTDSQPVWRQLGLLAFMGGIAGIVTLVTFIKRRPKTNRKMSEA